MSYALRENSVREGNPVELYRFVWGTTRWLYTSADQDIIFNSEKYTTEPIERSNFELTEDAFKNGLEFTVSRTNSLIEFLRPFPPDGPIALTAYRGHMDDGEFLAYWIGRISSVVDVDNYTSKILCDPLSASLKRPGNRGKYSKYCRYAHYKGGCRLNSELFKVGGVVDSISGTTITSSVFATQPDGWWRGGKIVVGEGFYGGGSTYLTGRTWSRWIIDHTGSSIRIASPMFGVPSSVIFNIYPGCDHSLATCDTKFSNSLNFGGQPWIPERSPFEGDGLL